MNREEYEERKAEGEAKEGNGRGGNKDGKVKGEGDSVFVLYYYGSRS